MKPCSGKDWADREVGRAVTEQPSNKGLEVGRLPGLQFVQEIDENELGWGQNRNALKTLSLKLTQLMQVRPQCRISNSLVSIAMCNVDWREEGLQIKGKQVAIQDWGSEDLEEARDAA